MLWNLGEGLAREPQWLNQFVITQTSWSTDLQTLDQHLAKTLTPILTPPPAAAWNGRYQLHVMDLSERSQTFVPGALYLAAPSVLCVENRIHSAETLAIWLRKRGASEVLGLVGRLPRYDESFASPSVDVGEDSIAIDGKSVDAPLIASPRESICVACGFVVVSADDSQRLWLVEAA